MATKGINWGRREREVRQGEQESKGGGEEREEMGKGGREERAGDVEEKRARQCMYIVPTALSMLGDDV